MAQYTNPAPEQLSFWRWLRNDPGPRRTRAKIAFALILMCGVFVLGTPFWYWLVTSTGPEFGDYSGAPMFSAALYAAVGIPFAGTTVYFCRPTVRRVYLLTSLWAVAAAFVAQLGIWAAVATSLDWEFGPIADKFLNMPLTIAALLPASLILVAAAYQFGWRRFTAGPSEEPRPPAP